MDWGEIPSPPFIPALAPEKAHNLVLCVFSGVNFIPFADLYLYKK